MENSADPETIALSTEDLFAVLKGDRNDGSERIRQLIEAFWYVNDWGYEVLSIRNVVIEEPVIFSDENASYPLRVEFKNCTFQQELRFDGGTFAGWIRIYDGSFAGLNVSGANFLGGLRISGGIFTESVAIDGGSFRRLRIYGGEFTKGIAITGGAFEGPIQIGDPKSTEKLELSNVTVDTRFGDRLELRNTSLEKLTLTNEIDSGGYIKIQDSLVRDLSLDVANFGHLLFLNVAPPTTQNGGPASTLSITNSQLGSAYFNNFGFDQYDSLVVVNSSLESIRQFGTTFPLDSARVYASNDHGEQDLRSLREVYNDLQNAAAKGKNSVLRHAYYAKQLEVYKQQLFSEKHYLTAFPLFASKFASNYGQDWLRALTFTAIATLVFYNCYLAFHPSIPFGTQHLSIKNVIFHASKYLEFVFPVHKFNLIPSPSNMSILVDLVGRIVSGFGLYHIVLAFRRYSMK